MKKIKLMFVPTRMTNVEAVRGSLEKPNDDFEVARSLEAR